MERRVRLALGILIILLMSPWSSMVGPEADEPHRATSRWREGHGAGLGRDAQHH